MSRLRTVAIFALSFLLALFVSRGSAADLFSGDRGIRSGAPGTVQKNLYDNGAVLFLLSNGLRVYVQPRPGIKNGLICASICHTGSQNEDPWLGTGISSLTGKLVGLGMTLYNKEEGDQNFSPFSEAVSTEIKKERTDFFATLPSSQIFQACDIFADRLLRAEFDAESFSQMKDQLCQERINEESYPELSLANTLEQAIYQIHPRRYPSGGYSSLLTGIRFEEVQRFYRERYTPNNTLFCIIGDVDPEAVVRRLAEAYRGTTREREDSFSIVEEPPQTTSREVILETEGRQCHLFFAWRTVPLTDPDFYPLQILSTYLSMGANTPLARLDRNGHRFESVFSSDCAAFPMVPGYFLISSQIQPGEILLAGEAIEALLDTLAQNGIPEKDLSQAKKITESSFVFGGEHLREIADMTVTNLLMTGTPNQNSTILERIRETGSEDIQRVIRRYLIPSRQNRILISPRGRLLSAVSRSEWSSPKLYTYRLPENGVQVVVKKTTTLPKVSVQILFLGGSIFETEENAGIGQLLAEMFGKGSAHYSQAELEEFFASIGGEYYFSSALNSFCIGMNVLESDWQSALTYLADALLFPNFSGETLEQAKGRMIQKIANRAEDPYRRLYDEFTASLPKSTPYHLPLFGTQGSISSVTVSDIKAHYTRVVVPERMVISIFGDVDPQEACTVARNLFFRIPSSSGDKKVPFDSYNMFRKSVELHKPARDGVGVGLMAWPAADMRKKEDDAALMVLKILLGGSRKSQGLLYRRLEESGFGNAVQRENFSLDQYRGPIAGYTLLLFGAPTEKIPAIFQEVDQEIERLRSHLLPEEMIERAKRQLVAELMQRETDADQARQEGLIRIYGLGENYTAELENAIDQVSPQTIATIVRKYFNVSMKVSTLPEESISVR